MNVIHAREVQSPDGFHQEFMGRIEEFSESWRNAAKVEKNFDKTNNIKDKNKIDKIFEQ